MDSVIYEASESVTERARRTRVTVGTIYLKLRSGRIPGARKDDRGEWRLPIQDNKHGEGEEQ